MIIEIWSLQAAQGKWKEASDWCKRVADAHNRQKSVVSARAFRSETGSPDEFLKIRIELDFKSMAERESYYEEGGGYWADEVQTLGKENTDNEYIVPDNFGHRYYSVLK